jgi:hypothetical protein
VFWNETAQYITLEAVLSCAPLLPCGDLVRVLGKMCRFAVQHKRAEHHHDTAETIKSAWEQEFGLIFAWMCCEAWRTMESTPRFLKSPHVSFILKIMLFASRISCVFVSMAFAVIAMFTSVERAFAQASIGIPVGFQKSTAQLTVTGEVRFRPQNCDIPVNESRAIFIFPTGDTTRRQSGQVVSITISGPHASDFRILAPSTLPAPVLAQRNGILITLQFNGSDIGERRATATIVTVDSTGAPIPNNVILNLFANRGRRTFELLQQNIDFGTLPPNTPATRTIPWLRNTGTVPITWQFSPDFNPRFRVLSTVPASVLDAGRRFLTTVQPGETMQLTMQFLGDLAGQMPSANFNPTDVECGPSLDFQVRAAVSQNPPNITARNIVQGVETPIRDQRLFLGNYDCEATKPAFIDTTIKIYNSGQETLIVSGASFDHPDFQVVNPPNLSPQNPLSITFNTSRDLTIRYTPRLASIDDILPVLTLTSNAANGSPTGSTTVNLRVRNDAVRFVVSRQTIDFGTVTRGGTLPAQSIIIRNAGTVIAPIPPFNSTLFQTTVSQTPLAPGDSAVVTFRVLNTATAGLFSETWNLLDLCNIATPITLRYSVNRPNPTIGLAVPVRFGNLVCSSDTLNTLTISNTGNDANDLVISDLRVLGLSSGAFSLVQPPALPITIPSGQSRTVQVRFRPLRTGITSDTLRITSNAEGTPVFNAALTGSKDSVSFSVSRTSINFVNILPNVSANEVITVMNTGSVPIQWGAGTFSIGSPFSLQFNPTTTPVGGSSQVTVTFLGSANDASTTARFLDICGRVQTVNVGATILRPYISATDAVSFGTLTCEVSSSAQITIANTGGQDLLVSAITSSSPLYRLQLPPLPLRISRGMPVSIPLTFTPSQMTLGAVPASISITSNAANGSTTTTLSAIKNTQDFEFLDLTPTDDANSIFRNIGTTPPNTPRTLTVRLRNTGNLPIAWRVPVFSADSLFAVESVAQNPTPPGTITTMTVRFRGSACPGQNLTSTGLPVLDNYGFDCRKPTARVILSAETLPASALLWTDTLRAGIGDTFSLPIRLRNPRFLREAGVQGFSFVLRYDFSVMSPQTTPKGAIQGQTRLQPVTLMLPQTISADSILGRIPFIATLGSTSGTLIAIDSLRAFGSTGASCILFDTSPLQSRFTLDRICVEGGMRLVKASGTRLAMTQNKPNPASGITTIDFSLIEFGTSSVTVYSMLGEPVLQAMSGRLEPGEYSLDMDVSRLPSGVYFYVLQTPTNRRVGRMEVIR